MRKKLVFTVPPEYDNVRAQRFLRSSCGLSARIITQLKREKNGILMDGKILRTIDNVYAGKTVEINLPCETSTVEPVSGKLNIAYEDDHLLIINKPPCMPVHPVKQHQTDTLANIVSHYCLEKNDSFVFRAVNRLDKDTSGLVIISKNKFCANALKNAVFKTYYAICEGKITSSGTVNLPIGLSDNSKIVRAVHSDGQPSVTHYKPLIVGNELTFLELWLETGRTHQIRCHMAHLGHPLIGDDLYGGGLDIMTRQALHCGKVCFIHPITKKEVTVKADLPDDMTKALNKRGLKP